MTAVAILHREEILHGLASGKRLSDLTAQLGVSPQAISKVLSNDPEYAAAIEQGHAVKLDRAEAQLEQAREQVDVSRARAVWDAYRWRAGVEASYRWGQKSEVKHIDAAPQLQIVIVAPQPSNANVTEKVLNPLPSGT